MKIIVTENFSEVLKTLDAQEKQVRFATAVALNRTAELAQTDVVREMRQRFDRPTPYFLRSLRVMRASANRTPLEATVWFKDRNSMESAESMVLPHIDGGSRRLKAFEKRLQGIGALPRGWYVVPGEGADLDTFGNISRGQISLLLNVLGAYKEAGYNKANNATIARLARGKKGRYGFVYWVNPVGGPARHLPPGVYKRVQTPFGSSLKPVLVFVSKAHYKPRLNFYAIVQQTVAKRFQGEFDAAYAMATRSAN